MSEGLSRTVEEITKEAERKGLVAFFPLPNEVMVDLDEVYSVFDKEDEQTARVLTAMQTNGYILKSSLRTTSKSGKQHIYYRFNRELDRMERLLIQAALGSDRVREFLGMVRATSGADEDTALFETLNESQKVVEWRIANE